jgi:general secretion pathway protein A
MYLELFNLHELPFRLSPDPQFLYLSKQHARAKAYMESTIWFTDGFVVITGEIGAGKTTLIETFPAGIANRCGRGADQPDPAVADGVPADRPGAIRLLAVQHEETRSSGNAESILDRTALSGRKVLLIVDEAQNLSLRVLEEVRMLSGNRDHQGESITHHSWPGNPNSTTSSIRRS